MRIGEVANRTGLSVDTIRYYERRGVIEPPERTPAGYRSYQPVVLQRLGAVRRMQQLGLSLDEITDALRANDRGEATCENQRWRLATVVERIDAQMAELATLRASINDAAQSCVEGRCDLVPVTR